jgi:2-keto-4-pentenoate hydratase/2-oxohepta-3-ene-1,7-dioic acid hydratase in catechol pathway
MKIIAIGRNYAAHIKELKNETPSEPVIFTKPDTALLKNNDPFYYPDFSTEIHYETEIIIRIAKEGKHIQKDFAYKYYDKIGIGIDFTARDMQSKAKEKGLPWALAKGFNGSAPVSDWYAKEDYDLSKLQFSMTLNDESKQHGDTSNMIHSIDEIIAYVSRFFTLKTGDIIFTGTPEGVGEIKIGDRIKAYLEDKKVLDFEIK